MAIDSSSDSKYLKCRHAISGISCLNKIVFELHYLQLFLDALHPAKQLANCVVDVRPLGDG